MHSKEIFKPQVSVQVTQWFYLVKGGKKFAKNYNLQLSCYLSLYLMKYICVCVAITKSNNLHVTWKVSPLEYNQKGLEITS